MIPLAEHLLPPNQNCDTGLSSEVSVRLCLRVIWLLLITCPILWPGTIKAPRLKLLSGLFLGCCFLTSQPSSQWLSHRLPQAQHRGPQGHLLFVVSHYSCMNPYSVAPHADHWSSHFLSLLFNPLVVLKLDHRGISITQRAC